MGGSDYGYEYQYRFLIDDDVIHRYSCFKLRDDIKFLFEMRTNFILKGGDCDCGGVDEIIDTERFELGEEDSDPFTLHHWFEPRLEDYWFSLDESRKFASQLSAFAAAAAAVETARIARRSVIPIAIEMDIRTVRQAGETLSDAKDRAIRSEKLFPLFLMYNRNAFANVESSQFDYLIPFLRGLYVKRVYCSESFESCCVCRGRGKFGDQIAVLEKLCGHAFHYHCFIHSMLKDTSCPQCSYSLSSSIEIENRNLTDKIMYQFYFM